MAGVALARHLCHHLDSQVRSLISETTKKQGRLSFPTIPCPPPLELLRHLRHRDMQCPKGDVPPVPLVLPRPRQAHQQKPDPVPSVLPPGYTKDTLWIADSSGRSNHMRSIFTRYGTRSPTILLSGQVQPQNKAPTPQYKLMDRSHPSADSQFTQPKTTSPPHTPFLNRMFGGFIGGRTAGSTLPTLIIAVLHVPQMMSRWKPKARTIRLKVYLRLFPSSGTTIC
ncbi:hypothetical protein DL96DRAFT_1821619 [Flagelloscypha sp. PMI_526]|nr:hypothetical protein DL96DRAFT_1821619 [Flagelloscypha sp. PMI_526]